MAPKATAPATALRLTSGAISPRTPTPGKSQAASQTPTASARTPTLARVPRKNLMPLMSTSLIHPPIAPPATAHASPAMPVGRSTANETTTPALTCVLPSMVKPPSNVCTIYYSSRLRGVLEKFRGTGGPHATHGLCHNRATRYWQESRPTCFTTTSPIQRDSSQTRLWREARPFRHPHNRIRAAGHGASETQHALGRPSCHRRDNRSGKEKDGGTCISKPWSVDATSLRCQPQARQ